jgi:hypothetical protein
MEEVWLSVPGYEGLYAASNLGRIRSFHRSGRMLAQTPEDTGYLSVCLSRDGFATKRRVNVVVLSTFCGAAPFEGAQAAHNNGDKADNRLVNLRWASAFENQADVDRHGRRCKGSDVFGAVLSEDEVVAIRARIASGERNRPIAEDYGVSISTVHLIRHRRTWRHV